MLPNRPTDFDRSHPGWSRLSAAVTPALQPHEVEPGALGEYALMLAQRGPDAAARAFPAVASHLARGCQRCAEDLRDFAVEGLSLEGPPPAWQLAWSALDRFRGLPRVLATLLGPPLQPLPTSQRGTQGELTRTYQAGAVTVSITVVPGEEAGGLAIEGLVGVGQATAGADRIALLIGPTGESHAVAVDELGNFALTGVSPGTYRLEVGLGDSIIVLEDLNIAPRG